jgi:peptidoglycan/LPS O-acetylase OafA/YrhL
VHGHGAVARRSSESTAHGHTPAPSQASQASQASRGPVAEPGRKLGRRPVLDGLRGIAVILVMLEHTGLVHNGFMGVDIFFGLSGFLITTLLYEEWERTGGISFRRFYERRARRLLPALLLLVGAFVLIGLTLKPFSGWPIGERALTTLGFVNNWFAGFGKSAQLGSLNPTWSLAQEEQFYLLWPVVLWFALRRGVRPWMVVAFLAAAMASLIVAVPFVHAADVNYSTYFSPLDRGAELLLGCAGATIWHYRMLRLPRSGRLAALGRALDRVPGRWMQALRALAAAPIIGLFVWMLLYDRQFNERSIFLGAAAMGVAAMLLLLDAPDALLTRVLACRPLRYVGRISYCLYLCHLLIHNLLVHYLPGMSVDLCAATTIVLALIVASISWRVLESRVLAAGRKTQRSAQPVWRGAEVQIAR